MHDNIKETTIPDLKKTLIHPMDNRTSADSKELAAQNPVIDTDKRYPGPGKDPE